MAHSAICVVDTARNTAATITRGTNQHIKKSGDSVLGFTSDTSSHHGDNGPAHSLEKVVRAGDERKSVSVWNSANTTIGGS